MVSNQGSARPGWARQCSLASSIAPILDAINWPRPCAAPFFERDSEISEANVSTAERAFNCPGCVQRRAEVSNLKIHTVASDVWSKAAVLMRTPA